MPPKISVITATKNAAGSIRALYASLCAQTYSNFEWIVADGASSDDSVSLLTDMSLKSAWVHFRSEPDFGIYDALNKAIRASSGDYYVVVGADDTLAADALRNFADSINRSAVDVILARVIRGEKVVGGFYPLRSWIGTARVFATSHSCGMLFRTALHEKFGWYSNRFPLLADVYFLKVLLRSKAVTFYSSDFIAGTFATGGLTSTNQLQILAENWQIQMLTEPLPSFQILLFLGKVLLRYPVVLREIAARRSGIKNHTNV